MDGNELLLKSFELHLRSERKSPKTIRSYLDTARLLAAFHDGKPLLDLDSDDIKAFIADQLDQWAPATAAVRFRSLRPFYKWAASDAEGLIAASPMAGLSQPSVPEVAPDLLRDEEIAALLKACEGREFTDRRDSALVRLMLIAGGPRLGEIAGMRVDDADLDHSVIHVVGKGSRPRTMPFSDQTAIALGRYLRERATHPKAKAPWFWLGAKGRLTESGITQALRRRAARAGIKHLHPHMLRHTAAHRWKSAGGSDGDAMRLFGWRSNEMLNRYGAKLADERAIEAARRMAIDDDL
jgi:site-specific recombinase XerD